MIKFTSIVMVRASGDRHTAKIEIPQSVWQEHGLKVGDDITVSIIGRVFDSKISGDDKEQMFRIPIELRRELRLKDSESIEVEIEKKKEVPI